MLLCKLVGKFGFPAPACSGKIKNKTFREKPNFELKTEERFGTGLGKRCLTQESSLKYLLLQSLDFCDPTESTKVNFQKSGGVEGGA